jgi:hypothetical protein
MQGIKIWNPCSSSVSTTKDQLAWSMAPTCVWASQKAPWAGTLPYTFSIPALAKRVQ